jgi:hypothetical protein
MNLGDNNSDAALGRAVEGTISLTAQLPNGKSIQMSGYVLTGDTLSDINIKLDVMVAAIERQRLIAEVPELEVKLLQLMDARTQMQAILETTSAKSKKTSQDVQHETTARINIKKLDADIERGEQKVAEAKRAAAAAKVV